MAVMLGPVERSGRQPDDRPSVQFQPPILCNFTPPLTNPALDPRNVPVGVRWAARSDATTWFLLTTSNGIDGLRLWRYRLLDSTAAWTEIKPSDGSAHFGVIDVDRRNPDRILASILGAEVVAMAASSDGGSTWRSLQGLDSLMTDGGAVRYRNHHGPSAFTSFDGYVQPTMVAFDPGDTAIVIAGAADAGIFLSRNGGTGWTRIHDTGAAFAPIPRPLFAFFTHDDPSARHHAVVYVGTQGRGVWKLVLPSP
jgi:hypothetical protein